MALIGRRRNEPSTPSPTKLAKMPTEDILLLGESAAMNVQQYLSVYRSCDEAERPAALAWLRSHVDTVALVTEELSQR